MTRPTSSLRHLWELAMYRLARCRLLPWRSRSACMRRACGIGSGWQHVAYQWDDSAGGSGVWEAGAEGERPVGLDKPPRP